MLDWDERPKIVQAKSSQDDIMGATQAHHYELHIQTPHAWVGANLNWQSDQLLKFDRVSSELRQRGVGGGARGF